MSIKKWTNRYLANRYVTQIEKSLDFYVNLLNQGIPFSFSRFGDGEWNAMLGKKGKNCDGHEYFPQMGTQLRETVIHAQDYFYAIQNMAIRNDGKAIASFCKEYAVSISWHNADVFHYANRAGQFFPMVETLRKMDVVLVGPAHLKPLNKHCLEYETFIEIPSQNCYLKLDQMKKAVFDYGAKKSGKVFAISASMAANVMIHDLYPNIGKENWLIDFGSVWDIYVGVKSREHYTMGNWEEIIKWNLQGKNK